MNIGNCPDFDIEQSMGRKNINIKCSKEPLFICTFHKTLQFILDS